LAIFIAGLTEIRDGLDINVPAPDLQLSHPPCHSYTLPLSHPSTLPLLHPAAQPPQTAQGDHDEGDRGPQKAVIASIHLAEVFGGRLHWGSWLGLHRGIVLADGKVSIATLFQFAEIRDGGEPVGATLESGRLQDFDDTAALLAVVDVGMRAQLFAKSDRLFLRPGCRVSIHQPELNVAPQEGSPSCQLMPLLKGDHGGSVVPPFKRELTSGEQRFGLGRPL